LCFFISGFWSPACLILGQRADAGTSTISAKFDLDQPKWKQFIYYLNDVSPISVYSSQELQERNIHYLGIGGDRKIVLKFHTCADRTRPGNLYGPCLWKHSGHHHPAFLAMFIAQFSVWVWEFWRP
jgi:hypothetical protein